MPESASFYCGACLGILRIFCYNICPCRKRKEVYKPTYNVLCLGLSGCGKSTLMATYGGEETSTIQPTTGFNMKDILLDTCTLNVKEIGGSVNVRKYWQNYFGDNYQGLIFVIDSTASGDELNDTMTEMRKVLINPQIGTLPCLFIATHQDLSNAPPIDEIVATFQIEGLCVNRKWAIEGCSSHDQAAVRVAFEKLVSLLWQDEQRQ